MVQGSATAILKNHRRHGLPEVAGRFTELLAPDMTVEHPQYRLHEGGRSIVLDEMEQVVAVDDHGFSGEVVFNAFVPAPMLGDSAFADIRAGDDPGEMYLLRRTLAFVWPYDERGRLIGEHVYEDGASREIITPDPADVITAERAAELLALEIDRVLP